MSADDVLLSPLEVRAAYAAVVERLRRSIALGIVLPGEKLPSERTLADGLGVSRVTVREALRVLQGEGLIETRRGGAGGAFVTSRDVSLAELRSEFHRARPEMEQVFEFRLAVESAAARFAADRRDEAELDDLAACQEALLASADVGDFRRADSSFHLTVAEASGNAMLRQSIEDARSVMFESFDAQPFKPLREASAAGHAAVIAAIARQDGDAAAAAMAEHLHQARREILAVLLGSE